MEKVAVVVTIDDKPKCGCGQDASVFIGDDRFCIDCYLKRIREHASS